MNFEAKASLLAMLVMTAGVAIIAAAAVVFLADYSPLKEPAKIEPRCSINGLGNGTCTFYNAGGRTGHACFDAVVERITTKGRVAGDKVCSGVLLPGDVKQLTFFAGSMSDCENRTLGWQAECRLVVR
jgi:hypothetical protein